MSQLYRSETDRVVGGVCGGIAETYDLDPSLVRIIAVLLMLSLVGGVLAYIIAWIIVPTESAVKQPGNG